MFDNKLVRMAGEHKLKNRQTIESNIMPHWTHVVPKYSRFVYLIIEFYHPSVHGASNINS